MPTLTEIIAAEIRCWPSLYACRTDVLHQWFCVNGNGMEWENGELVIWHEEPPHDAAYWHHQWSEDERKVVEDSGDDPHSLASRLTGARLRAAVDKFRIDNAESLALVAWSRVDSIDFGMRRMREVYPLCRYACMCNVPDDAKPDWLAAVREMIFVVFEVPVGTSCQYTPEQHAAMRASNIAVADTVLRNLHERFGSPQNMPTSHTEWLERLRKCATEIATMFAQMTE